MKKIFSLIAIAAVATTMFTSCKTNDSEKTDPQPTGKAKLTLEVSKTTIEVAASGTFTIKSSVAAPEAIDIAVASSDTKIFTVDPASVTIAKDTKTITGKFTGVAEGKAKITITTTSTAATIEKGEIEVTISPKGEALPEGEIVEANLLCDKDNVWSEEWFADFKIGEGTTSGFTLWFNNTVNLENTGCDYVGADLKLTAVEKGTEISTLTFAENLGHELMGVNGGTGYDQLPLFTKISGEKYVVFCVAKDIVPIVIDDKIQNVDDCTHDKPQVKGWALVSVSDSGNKVTLKSSKFPASKVGE